jgi:protein O-mannosyl-transferase
MSNRKIISKKLAPRVRPGMSGLPVLSIPILTGLALIIAISFIVYRPSLTGGFILDDDKLLTENRLITATDGLYQFWCTAKPADYWPVTNTSLWIEWRLWGSSPAGYHITNVILHIIASILIWIILRRLHIPGSFLAALIFAVHPVNVESVAWIAQRKNMLAMLFLLLSILWYLKFLERARLPALVKRREQAPGLNNEQLTADRPPPTFSFFILHPSSFHCWYWLSLAAFILAMLSKGSVVVLPLLLLLIVYWLRPLTRRDFVPIAPFFLVAAVLGAANVWFQTHGMETVYRTAGVLERLLEAGGVVWFYLYKAVLPIDLAFVYPQWSIQTDKPLWWMPLIAALMITAILWQYRKSWSRPFWFAWIFFCVALVPVMGFTDVGFMQYSLVADHYQHIAIIAVITLAAAGWMELFNRAKAAARSTVFTLAVACVGLLLFLTSSLCEKYRDPETLYRFALDKNQQCWMIYYNLGNTLVLADKPQKAVEYLEQAVRLKTDYPEAHNNLGLALSKVGRMTDAIKCFEEALRLNNDFVEARLNLGLALIAVDRPGEAIDHFNQALRFKPDDISIYSVLMAAYARIQQPLDAIAAGEKAIELARSQGQEAQANQMQNWLNSYRAGLIKSRSRPSDSKSAPPR